MELFSRATTNNSQQQRGEDDLSSVAARIKASLYDDLTWLKNAVRTRFPNAPIVFCHNDVNAANILLNVNIIDNEESKGGESSSSTTYDRESVCIIDYEYGSTNYAMYDVANFVCEHCGGNDNGIPNYDLLPSSERMVNFLQEYVCQRDEILEMRGSNDGGRTPTGNNDAANEVVSDLHSQVQIFQLASNLYWGIWGILQAAGEVDDGTFRTEDALARMQGRTDLDTWDNLRYGRNRLERYRFCKEEILRSGST
jgi:thiamine kinase-like enzyme